MVNPFVKNKPVFARFVHRRDFVAVRARVTCPFIAVDDEFHGCRSCADVCVYKYVAFYVVERLRPVFKHFAVFQTRIYFFLRGCDCRLAVFYDLGFHEFVVYIEIHGERLDFPLSVKSRAEFDFARVKRFVSVFVHRPADEVVSFARGRQIGYIARRDEFVLDTASVLCVKVDGHGAELLLPARFVARKKRRGAERKQCYHAHQCEQFSFV